MQNKETARNFDGMTQLQPLRKVKPFVSEYTRRMSSVLREWSKMTQKIDREISPAEDQYPLIFSQVLTLSNTQILSKYDTIQHSK